MLRAIVKTTPNIKGQKCTYFFGWDFGFAMGWGIVGGFRIGEGWDFGVAGLCLAIVEVWDFGEFGR